MERTVKSACEYPPGRLDFFPVMRATLINLDRWVRDGFDPPPSRLMPLEPRLGEKSVLQAPSHLPKAIVQVPVRDADGNALGGVRLPDMEAPLGTHGAQNFPLNDRACNLNAAFIAFAKSSIEERYRTHEGYVGRIRAAAQRLVGERFLTEQDAQEIVRAAEAASVP